MIIRRLWAWLAILLIATGQPAVAAGVKPVVISPTTGQHQQIQANATLQLNAGATGNATLNCPQGAAPTSPNNGDVWCTSAGVFAQINGATVGPLSAGCTFANPTATASDTAVNGSATTCPRSDSAPAVQKAGASQFGLMKPDGISITCPGGVCSATAGGGVYEPYVAPPLLTGLTWNNQGGALTATQGTNSIVLTSTGRGTAQFGLLYQAAPSLPFTVYMRVHNLSRITDNSSVGVALYNSTSGRLLTFTIGSQGNHPVASGERYTAWQAWNSTSSFNTDLDNRVTPVTPPHWLAIVVTSTTATPYISANGVDYVPYGSAQTLSGFLTATGSISGVGIVAYDNAALQAEVSVLTTTLP